MLKERRIKQVTDQPKQSPEQAPPEDDSLLPAIGSKTGVVLDRILPYLMSRLTFSLNQMLKTDLKKFGLTISNWRVLAVLAAETEVTVNELAEYAMIEQSTASHLIDRMEEEGLLVRKRGEGDGRVRSISLTETGQEKYETVRHTVLAHTNRVLRDVTPEERQALETTLTKMRNNLGLPL